MFLQIEFKSGESRRINLNPLFFVEDKLTKVTISQKCLTMAADMGGAIHTLLCDQSGKKMFESINPGNALVENEVHKVNELKRKERKALRQEHKNDKFVQVYNYTGGMFRNLLSKSTITL